MNSDSQTIKLWRGRIIRYVPFILCVLLIFGLSTGTGSMSKTSLFIRPLLEFLFPNADAGTLIYYHGYIRKLAHLTEYGLLAFTAARAFRSSSKRFLSSHWVYAAIFSVVTVAAADEYYQSFNPERTGSIYDVLIDITGGILGLLFITFFSRLWNRQRNIEVETNISTGKTS